MVGRIRAFFWISLANFIDLFNYKFILPRCSNPFRRMQAHPRSPIERMSQILSAWRAKVAIILIHDYLASVKVCLKTGKREWL